MGQSLKTLLDQSLINAMPIGLKKSIEQLIALGENVETVRQFAVEAASKRGYAPCLIAAINALCDSKKS